MVWMAQQVQQLVPLADWTMRGEPGDPEPLGRTAPEVGEHTPRQTRSGGDSSARVDRENWAHEICHSL